MTLRRMSGRGQPGFFITLEGGEGSGKSTHAKLLADRLVSAGRDVVVTREPGGAPEAEAIRKLLLGGEPERWSPLAEALLNYAARDNHLSLTIRPALARGAVVVSDRFMDSTTAYQGYAGGVDLEFIKSLERAVVGETRPVLTIVFDVDPELGLERARQRDPGHADRFERKGLAFHQRLRAGFLEIARAEPGRCVLVDATRDKDEVARTVWDVVAARIAG
jgi:dTMP kinase